MSEIPLDVLPKTARALRINRSAAPVSTMRPPDRAARQTVMVFQLGAARRIGWWPARRIGWWSARRIVSCSANHCELFLQRGLRQRGAESIAEFCIAAGRGSTRSATPLPRDGNRSARAFNFIAFTQLLNRTLL